MPKQQHDQQTTELMQKLAAAIDKILAGQDLSIGLEVMCVVTGRGVALVVKGGGAMEEVMEIVEEGIRQSAEHWMMFKDDTATMVN